MVKYPSKFFIRISEEDQKRIKEASIEEEIPPSTLARRILRQWLQSNEFRNSEKPQSQLVNPPAA